MSHGCGLRNPQILVVSAIALNHLFDGDRDRVRNERRIVRDMPVVAEQHTQ
jgi:uncharacterized protein with ACT and thioredoxin-like domain